MDSLQFCYFLQGFLEINNNPDQQMSAQQVQIIKDHLNLVFTKVTPNYVLPTTSITYPFYRDSTDDSWKNNYGNLKWDEDKKVWRTETFNETPQVSC